MVLFLVWYNDRNLQNEALPMKFELNEYHRNVSDEELLADIKRVDEELKMNKLTRDAYKNYGRYSPSTIERRFGGWNKVLELCGIETIIHQVATSDILKDIKRVAALLNKETISSLEYQQHGTYSRDTCSKRFSSWNDALQQAGLKPFARVSNQRIDDDAMLKEIERIWIKLGRQPTSSDIKAGISQYSLHAYAEHFGGWRGALQAFMQYIEAKSDDESTDEKPYGNVKDIGEGAVTFKENEWPLHKTSRDVNYRLRFKVMHRDNFKCCICGNSPAKDPAIELHIDHIIPWSKGGETVMENLQTLCSKCNLGKSNLEM